jgi:prevent-host-death family protein
MMHCGCKGSRIQCAEVSRHFSCISSGSQRHADSSPRLNGLVTAAILAINYRSLKEKGMTIKFSEDLVPLTDLKVNPGRVVKHSTDSHRPVLLTSRGRAVAVVQSVADYEKAEEERAFMRAVVAGLADLEAGRLMSLSKARARLGLK